MQVLASWAVMVEEVMGVIKFVAKWIYVEVFKGNDQTLWRWASLRTRSETSETRGSARILAAPVSRNTMLSDVRSVFFTVAHLIWWDALITQVVGNRMWQPRSSKFDAVAAIVIANSTICLSSPEYFLVRFYVVCARTVCRCRIGQMIRTHSSQNI